MFGPIRKPSRLGQWNGRRRSSRSAEPILSRLCQRAVATRLALVLVTALAVTALACFWGPPLPYRAGRVYPNDIRVRVDFEIVNQPQTERAREEAIESLPVEELSDSTARKDARAT